MVGSAKLLYCKSMIKIQNIINCTNYYTKLKIVIKDKKMVSPARFERATA